MSKGTKERTPKRSPLPVVGLAVGKRSDDGESLLNLTPPSLPSFCHTILPKYSHSPRRRHMLPFSTCTTLPNLLYPKPLPHPDPRTCSNDFLLLIFAHNTPNIPSTRPRNMLIWTSVIYLSAMRNSSTSTRAARKITALGRPRLAHTTHRPHPTAMSNTRCWAFNANPLNRSITRRR